MLILIVAIGQAALSSLTRTIPEPTPTARLEVTPQPESLLEGSGSTPVALVVHRIPQKAPSKSPTPLPQPRQLARARPRLPKPADYPRAEASTPAPTPVERRTRPREFERLIPALASKPLPEGNGQFARQLGLHSTAERPGGAALGLGSVDSNWTLVDFHLAPGTIHVTGTRYPPGCPLYAVESFFGRPAISPDKTSEFGPTNPQNGYYTYQTFFTVPEGVTTRPIEGKVLIDDAVLSISLNGHDVALSFFGSSTTRTIDGVTFARYHERAAFTLASFHPGKNELRIVTMNQLLGQSPTPHSLEVNFDEAFDQMDTRHPIHYRRKSREERAALREAVRAQYRAQNP